jgi:hypothetical protein
MTDLPADFRQPLEVVARLDFALRKASQYLPSMVSRVIGRRLGFSQGSFDDFARSHVVKMPHPAQNVLTF